MAVETIASLIFACRLDGAGGAVFLDRKAIDREPGDPARPLWIHLNRKAANTREWLVRHGRLNPLAVEALLEEDTRPRFAELSGGALLNLRGINTDATSPDQKMVSCRMWLEEGRLVSARAMKIEAVATVSQALERGEGPKNLGELVVALAEGLIDRIDPELDALDEALSVAEVRVIEHATRAIRRELGDHRRAAMTMRRYIGAQREALTALMRSNVVWLGVMEREKLHELWDQVTRNVEDLDIFRERAGVLQDELSNRIAERMDRVVFRLTLVATLFLPLGFVTSLLGVNLGGIPGADSPWGFATLCLILLGFGGLEYWLIKRLRQDG